MLTTVMSACLAGCGQNSPPPKKPQPPVPVDPTIAEIAIVKTNITQDLLDPWTARFRNVQRVQMTAASGIVPAQYVYCGEVNAKNQFGAYVGFRHFMSFTFASKPGQPSNVEGPDNAYQSVGWSAFCKGKSGMPVQF